MKKKRLLFITPEMQVTGAVRIVLEMCKAAKELDYVIEVWSPLPGPFEQEYRMSGVKVVIVPHDHVRDSNVVRKIKGFDLAICNTINTDAFARICSRYIPTVWFIHEADNLSMFLNNNERRLDWLKHSYDIVCVSDYAAEKVGKFTKHNITVVKNGIEDVADKYPARTKNNAEIIRFIQLGYIESIKGYDILLDAFQRLSSSYKEKVELYFAGRVISRTKEYAEKMIDRASKMDFVTYLGELSLEDALKAISESDVVIVASRGESCSMVTLEGAMLSKPLIVTESVGAKYMVKDDNGYIVKTEDADSLKSAIEKMVDRKDQLEEMGRRSRVYYEEMANFDAYRRELDKLFRICEKKEKPAFILERLRNHIITSDIVWGLRALKKYGPEYTFKHFRKRIRL